MNTALSRLILIANNFTVGGTDKVLEAINAGVRWVHLRDHNATDEAFQKGAVALARGIKQVDQRTLVSINGRRDLALQLGLHYHANMYGSTECLPNPMLTGYSAHKHAEPQQDLAGFDYLFFSPVFPTPSKPGHPGVGIDALAKFCRRVAPVPVFALGGISPARCEACLQAGAYGVAVISGIIDAPSISTAVKDFDRELTTSE